MARDDLWIGVHHRKSRASGSALVTIAVSNLDAHAAAVVSRGLSLDEQAADSSAPQQLTITDGDGNLIKFFEDPANSAG